MKRYFYHVVFDYRTKDLALIGCTGIEISEPIEDEETLLAVAERIKDDKNFAHLPTITNFILLRTEDVEPCDPDTNDPSQFPACGDDILVYR